MANLQPGDIAIDCTAGGGGHLAEFLKVVGETGLVIGFDRDPVAIKYLSEKFAKEIAGQKLQLIPKAFGELAAEITALGLAGKISAISADLGVSSPQLDVAERGFSFAKDGPLDMRMDTNTQNFCAANIVNEWPQEEIAKIFYELGEEPKSRKIAEAIVKVRVTTPFTTTTQLAQLVADVARYPQPSRTHPATRVFQALRLAVNDELGQLTKLLNDSLTILKPGGRLAVISFHSLEDRLVKRQFAAWAGKGKSHHVPRDLPFTAEQMASKQKKMAEAVEPYPCNPGDDEIRDNPRARSAHLRVAQKL